jgi:hypothetical protein
VLLDAERRDEQDDREAERDDLPPLPTPGLAGEPSEAEQLPG